MSTEASFVEIVRQVYLRRSTGFVSFADGDDRYFFNQGELYIDARHVLAPAVRERLAAAQGRPAGDAELRKLSLSVVEPALGKRGEPRFDGGADGFPTTLVGPLATVSVVMEIAVRECDEQQLIERLGGKSARYHNAADSPALQQLPGLEQDMVQLMAHLETPTPVQTVIQLQPGRKLETLRALTKLRSIGLAAGNEPAAGGSRPGASRDRRARRRDRPQTGRESKVVNARTLELFSERIADDLEQTPLRLPTEEHRRRLAHWLQHQASLSHYELLGLDPRAGDEMLHQKYRELARQVHPIHVQPLGLQGRGEALRLLFERVTEAYLVLSDPRRRAGYDLMVGVPVAEEVGEEKRRQEKERMAASCYSNALHYLSEHVQDYGQAVDLLREAVRLDPKASYYSMLAQAQAQNPRWRPDAIESFRRAVELNPKDAGIRVAFADVLERDGDLVGAKEQFRAALEDMPNHPLALKGLERLAGVGGIGGGKAGIGGLRDFFKK